MVFHWVYHLMSGYKISRPPDSLAALFRKHDSKEVCERALGLIASAPVG